MEPSLATQPRKKKVKGKAKKLSAVEVNEEYTPGRQNYTDEETMLLTRCWVDISYDLVYSNNRKQVAYWERIVECYNELKPAASYKRKKEQLRKHWDRVKKEVNLFSAEYTKCMRAWGSSESLEDVRDKVMMSYMSLYGAFKHYGTWSLVKDKPKFQGGIAPASSASKRTKNAVTRAAAAQHLRWTSTRLYTRMRVPAHRGPLVGVPWALNLPRARGREGDDVT